MKQNELKHYFVQRNSITLSLSQFSKVYYYIYCTKNINDNIVHQLSFIVNPQFCLKISKTWLMVHLYIAFILTVLLLKLQLRAACAKYERCIISSTMHCANSVRFSSSSTNFRMKPNKFAFVEMNRRETVYQSMFLRRIERFGSTQTLVHSVVSRLIRSIPDLHKESLMKVKTIQGQRCHILHKRLCLQMKNNHVFLLVCSVLPVHL